MEHRTNSNVMVTFDKNGSIDKMWCAEGVDQDYAEMVIKFNRDMITKEAAKKGITHKEFLINLKIEPCSA